MSIGFTRHVGQFRLGCWAACAWMMLAPFARADDLSEEEARQRQTAERFLSILEKSPRRGTALDRVYGHHVEFGTLEQFMDGLRARVKDSPDDGAGWMLLGLFEAQRGEDAAAAESFRQAEALRPEDAMPPYYRGQSLLLIGDPDGAAAAFEVAITRKPARADLLEIFQQLGRVHQRAQRTEEALNVWKRLEAMFPDDARVQEQIAATLVEEGQPALALPRYEQLARLVKDDYRRTVFAIEAAELKVKLNRRDEGLADLEKLLAELNPEGWLHRDVRRRVENVFLRTDDQDGLVKYYEKWLEAHPDDVEGMSRLARYLARAARVPEATAWMEKALRLAPSRTDLRRSFIAQLVDDQRYPEALAQYASLDAADPGNPDLLRDWGQLVLKDRSQPIESRKAEAARLWNQIVAARPDDPLTAVQTADLFRHAELSDEALALYIKAVELAPDDPQYREYLGEFYHILKRPEDALATWREIAEGPRHTAENVARLAEIYNGFGYLPQAVEQIAEACRLEARDFGLLLRAADYHSRAGKHDEALTYAAAAEQLAASDEEREAALAQRIEVLQSSDRLTAAIDELAARVNDRPESAIDDWHVLARYYEAARRWTDASAAIDAALQKDAQSIPVLTTAARIAELSGNIGVAADFSRRLAAVDRRARGDHLMNVARLESQLGRTEEALTAGRDLIASAPGNTDHYEFHAQLCLRLGQVEEGLDTLRKAVRINASEPTLVSALAQALADQFRTDEAIQIYWQAFEKYDELEDRTQIIGKLTDLHLQLNQFDRLIERLERDRQDDDRRREMTICLAQAHHSAGDFGSARTELEGLLSQETRDTQLLQQLSKLCEEAQDIEAAIKYQEQLAEIAPGYETEFRLATLLQANGEVDRAVEIYTRLTQREEDASRRLRSLDGLIAEGAFEAVLEVTDALVREDSQDWEALYRQGVAWASLEREAEAASAFQRLLALNVPYDALGVRGQEQLEKAQARAKSNNLRGVQTALPTRPAALTMTSVASSVLRAVGIQYDDYYAYSPGRRSTVWAPSAFGEARVGAYGWLLKFARNENREDEFVAELRERAEAPDADAEVLTDYVYLQTLRSDRKEIFEVARRLALVDSEGQKFFLRSLVGREVNTPNSQSKQPKPLSEEDLELMLKCYRETSRDSDAVTPAGSNYIVSSNGTLYVLTASGSYVQVNGAGLGQIVTELELAGRKEDAERMIAEEIESADTAAEIVAVMNLCTSRKEVDRARQLMSRWLPLARTEAANRRAASRSSPRYSMLGVAGEMTQWMGLLAADHKDEDLLALIDEALDLVEEDARLRQADASPRRRPRTLSVSTRGYSTYYGTQRKYSRVDFPSPNDFLDSSALMLLRQAHDNVVQNDVASDLTELLKRRLSEAAPENAVTAHMLLGAHLWWLEERDEAIAHFEAAADKIAGDPTYRLEVALLYEAQQDYTAALDIVDSVVARDQKLLQQREIMALQLAVRMGAVDRARKAAERLFGLRLDSDTQLALATHMQRLGLNAMAEAVIARLQRRAGNQPTALVGLMAQYQAQGKTALAQQVAHTLLRTTRPSTTTALGSRVRSSNDYSGLRAEALRLLHRTGALEPTITRLQQQIERSPNSPRLYEQLIECYGVTGDREKIGALLRTVTEQRPDSVELRVPLAKFLETTGDVDGACDQYLEVLRRQPALVRNEYYELNRVFERAKRQRDLAEAYCEMNLSALSHPYYISDLAQRLLSEPETQDLGVRLTERMMEQFPTYRSSLLANLSNAALWKVPQIFEIGKRATIPTADQAATRPFYGIDEIRGYSGDGRVYAGIEYLLDGAVQASRLDDLEDAIREGLKGAPDWHGGKVLLAMVDMRRGRHEDAGRRLEALLADEKIVSAMPTEACWLVGQEILQAPGLQLLALSLFERAAKEQSTSSMELSYSPILQLIRLQGERGDRQLARETLQRAMKSQTNPGYDNQYYSYRQTQSDMVAAREFERLEFPVDAIRLYRSLLNDPEALKAAGQYQGNNEDYFRLQAENGLRNALESLDPAATTAAMAELLSIPENAASDTSALDLMVYVRKGVPLSDRVLGSQVLDLVDTVAGSSETSEGISTRLDELVRQRPGDLSAAIANAVFRLTHDADSAAEAVQHLVSAAASSPLEDLPNGARANSRQRRAAADRIPLWLAARLCLKQPELHATGRTLAEAALAAAVRHGEDPEHVAILAEWGRLALERGDRAEAERRWTQLLDGLTKRPDAKSNRKPPSSASPVARPAPASAAPGSCDGGAAAPASEVADRPAVSAPPLTVSRFQIIVDLAGAAARHDMPELSLRAIREALRGGPPVADVSETIGASTRLANPSAVSVMNPSSTSTDAGQPSAAQPMLRVLDLWQAKSYPPEEVYPLIRDLVLPPERPGEIRLYADTSQVTECHAWSLGPALCFWAERAGANDALSAELARRAESPAAALPALVLQTQQALEAGDEPASLEWLTKLETKLQTEGLPTNVLLACHAAIPAFERPALRDAAAPILKRAVQARGSDDSSSTNLGRLSILLCRHLAEQGREPEIRQIFDEYLAGRQSYYARYSGTYGLRRQWMDWAELAGTAAEVGADSVALHLMGQVADFSLEGTSQPSLETALAILSRRTASRPADERYERWRDWTLPREDRKNLRHVGGWNHAKPIPAAFAKLCESPDYVADTPVLSTWRLLLDAAEESGRLKELKAALAGPELAQTNGCDVLAALVLARMQEVDAAKQAFARLSADRKQRLEEARTKESKQSEAAVPPDPWMDILLHEAALRIPGLETGFQPFLSTRSDIKNAAQLMTARQEAAREGFVQPGAAPGLIAWAPAASEGRANATSWWTTHGDLVAHLYGEGTNSLYLRWPLTGDFEFSAAVWSNNGRTSSGIGYGGLMFRPGDSAVQITSHSGHESISRTVEVLRPGFNRMLIRSKDGLLTYECNGLTVYSEPAVATSPWLYLSAPAAIVNGFKDVRLVGTPSIPRQVPLVAGDRIDGWSSSFYGESQPRRRLIAERENVTEDDPYYYTYNRSTEPTEYDWTAVDGVLVGRVQPNAEETAASRVSYERPLQSGDRVRYEFFADENAIVHPTIGNLALLLTSQGIDSRWLLRNESEAALAGLPLIHTLHEESCQRAESLSWKRDEWNEAEVSLTGDVVRVTLNGALVFERTLAPENDRRFGFFRPKRVEARIRNIVLTGDWPEAIPENVQTNLAAVLEPPPAKTQRWIDEQIGDEVLEDHAALLARAAGLDEQAACELLREWVLPSERHAHLRVDFDRAPLVTKDSPADAAVAAAGGLRSPALALARLAARLGNTQELLAAAAAAEDSAPSAPRTRLALSAILQIAAGEDAAAEETLCGLYKNLAADPPGRMEVALNRPAYLAAWSAASRPALVSTAFDLAHLLEKQQLKAKAPQAWGILVSELLSRLATARTSGGAPAEADDTAGGFTQWDEVPVLARDSVFDGSETSRWRFVPGGAEHEPRETWSQLFFQSPLTGTFQVELEKTQSGYRDALLAYGLVSYDGTYDKKSVEVITLPQASQKLGPLPAIPGWSLYSRHRLEVDGSRLTRSINGVEIHTGSIYPQPDPWLILQARRPMYAASYHDVRITGNPVIPDEIELTRLSGWSADFYGGSIATEPDNRRAVWKYVNGEISGARLDSRPIPNQQAWLYYHRPMLEDGVVEYQSYYIPGETEVHPAIGRMVFLLRPAGVTLHRLTDAEFELSGRAPDNEAPIDGALPPQLQEKQWNAVRIEVQGDEARLTVNDREVAKITLPRNEPRFVGLFRYADQSGCRVKDMHYRGEWPKSLPAVDQQELAAAGRSLRDEASSNLIQGVEFNFVGPQAEADLQALGRQPRIKTGSLGPAGLAMPLAATDAWAQWPTLKLPRPPQGDFDITVDFAGLESDAVSGWGAAFTLVLSLQEARKSSVEASVFRNGSGAWSLRSGWRRTMPDGTSVNHDPARSTDYREGRLRISRRGGEMNCQYARPDSEEFTTLEVVPCGDAPLAEAIVQCKGAAGSTMTGRILKVSVRAERLEP